MAGQPQIGSNGFIEMDCLNCNVSSAGLPSTMIIEPGQSFSVSTNFKINGLNWSGLLTIAETAGPGNSPLNAFRVEYMFESMGSGPEGTLGAVNIKADHTKTDYDAADTTLHVGGGTLPAGVYRMVTVVKTLLPGHGFVTGFNEGPIIQQQ